MIRQRKPIARSLKPIRKRRKAKKSSLRYEVIDGKYRKYPDGRLVAQNTPKGELWYWEQTVFDGRSPKVDMRHLPKSGQNALLDARWRHVSTRRWARHGRSTKE